MSVPPLSERQLEVLDYLDRCSHSTANIMRQVWGRFPSPTLHSLLRRGYVTVEYSRISLSRNTKWTITQAGRDTIRSRREEHRLQ